MIFPAKPPFFWGDFPCFFPPEPGLFRCPGASVAGPKGQGMWQVRWIDLEVGGALFGLFFVVAFLLVEVGNFGAISIPNCSDMYPLVI